MRKPRFPSGSTRRAFNPLDHAFPAQRAAIEDTSTQVALLCSGRAGKTTAASLKWHHVRLQKPGRTSIFVALTRDHAKAILWQELKRQNNDWGLDLTFSESELTVRDSSGSVLRLLGANRDDLVDVLRGFPMVLALFDEAAFIRRGLLERCVDDVVLIRLFDFGGQCWIMSTPGLVPGGYFHSAVTGKIKGWSRHSWTLLENPHIPKIAAGLPPDEVLAIKNAWIAAEMARKGWTIAHPSYQREFLGQYASDPGARVYPIEERNIIQRMPLSWYTDRGKWATVLGIDYGVRNATAHVLCAFEWTSRDVYVVRTRRDVGAGPSEVANITHKWITDESPNFVVGDAGGLGKGYTTEFSNRFGLAIECADKPNKRGHQEIVAGAIKCDPPRLFVVEPGNEEIITEAEQLTWEEFPVDDPRYRLREDPRGKKDLLDAFLYSYMKATNYFPAEAENPISEPGERPREVDEWVRYAQ